MSKVIDFFVDEDNLVQFEVIDNVEDFYEKTEYMWGVYSELNDYVVEKGDEVICDGFDDFDDYGEMDLDEEENVKFEEGKKFINEFLRKNEGYMLLSYSVEYDRSWLVITKEDWNKVNDYCDKRCEEEDEEFSD